MHFEEALDLQERVQLRQLRGPLYLVWLLSAISFAYIHVAQGSNPCALLLTAMFCAGWTVAIRRVTRKYEQGFAERRAELHAFRAGGAPPAVAPGRPEPFTEDELDWAIAKQRRGGIFITVWAWLLVGWFVLVDASVPTVAVTVVCAVVFTIRLVHWLRRLPEARAKAAEQLRALAAGA